MTDPNTKKAEKLIITMEVDYLPDTGFPIEFYFRQVEDIWLNRFHAFRNWKRIKIISAPITKLDVQKLPNS